MRCPGGGTLALRHGSVVSGAIIGLGFRALDVIRDHCVRRRSYRFIYLFYLFEKECQGKEQILRAIRELVMTGAV